MIRLPTLPPDQGHSPRSGGQPALGVPPAPLRHPLNGSPSDVYTAPLGEARLTGGQRLRLLDPAAIRGALGRGAGICAAGTGPLLLLHEAPVGLAHFGGAGATVAVLLPLGGEGVVARR